MTNKTILITGATGKLGNAIIKHGFSNHQILTPTHTELDISNYETVKKYFEKHP